MIELLYNVDMSQYASMRVGGKAAAACFPTSKSELSQAIDLCRENGMKYTVIGNCSNVVFSDGGYDGCVIFTAKMSSFEFDGEYLTAYAGAPLTAVAYEAMQRGLSGLEFAYGIPGTVGGAVFMNAGAYGGEISDIFVSCDCFDGEGIYTELKKSDMTFLYRHSALQKNGCVMISAKFRLTQGDKDTIKRQIDSNMASRISKQPLDMPSCGSAFKRPEGHYAGALIEQAGLKGYSVGGARVSTKHAGFIVNTGNATASDVFWLTALIRDHVFLNSGVELEPEIRFID